MTEPINETFRIIMIGSSTGGLPVIERILSGINKDRYAVLVAQHMPEGYTGMWSVRLNKITPFTVKEGSDGEQVLRGHAYIAPGNKHMYLSGEEPPSLIVNSEPPVNRFRPSIDVLFASALNHPPDKIIAVMLTGMCDDGVTSMIEMRKGGFLTIAQNKESSAVFGMNREAIDRGGAGLVFSPDDIIEYLNGI
ncbi:MAG TPA: CheB methylesterase domain-containing protein [Spirochaetota bacterium]|nr:CheB methylesterase domain-containing protein [Spirochaetota bacterium]